MAETVKTIENVDRLFSQIIVNGEVHESSNYVPPVVPQQNAPVIETPEEQSSQNNNQGAQQSTQGEDVYAVELNDVLHNFVDQAVTQGLADEVTARENADTSLDGRLDTIEAVIPSSASSSNKLVDQDSIGTIATDAVNAVIETLDVAQSGGNGKYIKAISEADGKISATEGTIDSSVSSGSSNPVTSGAVQSALALIDALIPSQASAENQLADKNFVNSSIASNTANFIGTFESVTQLQAYSGTVTNNDYAFVRNTVVQYNGGDFPNVTTLNNYSKTGLTNGDYAWVVNAEDNTKFDLYRFDIVEQTWLLRATKIDKSLDILNGVFNRYKATVSGSTVTWAYEYTLNNSSFTAEQWATINSGLTQASVTSEINTAVAGEVSARNTAITNAINALDVTEKGGSGKYIKAIKETNGKISATEGTVDSSPSSGSDNLITSGAVYTGLDGKVDKSGAVTGVKGNSETDYRTGDVNITKGNIGLGSVVNTGDGTAPVSGGTTKFTTGGAYTELMKKANTIEGITAVGDLEYTANQDVFIVDFINKLKSKYSRYATNTIVKFSWSIAKAVNLVFVASPTTSSTRINTSGLTIIGNLVTISSSSAWVDMNLLFIDVNNVMYRCRITKGEASATVSVSLVKLVTGVSGVKGNSETNYRTGDVNITKSNIGLGSVVNTGDSATPVSGGTTKFTTGGAYTELAKKVNNSESCAYKYYGTMNGTTEYATITFSETSGAIIVTTGYSSSIVFDANKGTPMRIASSAYGVTGYAWSSDGKTLYLKLAGYRPIAVILPSVKRTEVGTIGDTGIKVNFSDVTTTAPSGITFSTTFNQVDTVSGRNTAISTAEANAKNLANATGTLAVEHGGTGETTVEEASASFGAIAYCDTGATTVAKTAVCYGYKLIIGQAVKLYIATANTRANPTLNINETGAKSIYVDGVAGSTTNLTAGWYVCLYDGNFYQLFSANTSVLPSSGCAVCHTAGGTAGKVASMPNFKLQSGTTFLITFVNANTKNTALTLNINNTGAKTIYINGTVSSESNYTIPAGTYVCRYNGTNYYIDTSYAVPNARSANSATSATSAGKWTTSRNFTISDADGSNSGTAVSVNGESAVTLKLPSTIKANIEGSAVSAGTCDSTSIMWLTPITVTYNNTSSRFEGTLITDSISDIDELTLFCVKTGSTVPSSVHDLNMIITLKNSQGTTVQTKTILNVIYAGIEGTSYSITANTEYFVMRVTRTNSNYMYSKKDQGFPKCGIADRIKVDSGTANIAVGAKEFTPTAGTSYSDFISYVVGYKVSTTGGYILFSNGFRILWGIHTNTGGNVTQYVTFSSAVGISFTQPPIITADYRMPDGSTVFYYAINIYEVSKTGFRMSSNSSFNNNLKFFWIAMGY